MAKHLKGKGYNRHALLKKLFSIGETQCIYCDRTLTQDTATIEHLKRRTDGGNNSCANVTLACAKCNCHRGEISPLQHRINRIMGIKKSIGTKFSELP